MDNFKSTYFQVRVPGDSDFDWFEADNYDFLHYDPCDAQSAIDYAHDIAPAWVVRIDEIELARFN